MRAFVLFLLAACACSKPPAPRPEQAAAAPSDETFTHSKLGFTFAYPPVLVAKEDASGVTLESAPIARVEDRSGDKGDVRAPLSIRVTLEQGAVVSVASKTNPAYAESFPGGSEARFAEQKGFAEKIRAGSATGYRFTIGSHGENQRDTFLPAKSGATLVVSCAYVGESLSPRMTEADQLAACDKVVSTLKP